MKNRIMLKLSVYFAIVLLLFAVIVGALFMTLFREYTIRVGKADLEARAVKMAETLSGYMSGGAPQGMGGGNGMAGGYGAYLRFLDDIAMSDVWIVDENLDLLTSRSMGAGITYADLPANAESVVQEVFAGKTTFSTVFGDLLHTPSITVGTPIMDGTDIVGALLLHAPVSGLDEGIARGFWILAVSIAAALVLAIALSVRFAFVFTRPLSRMKGTALRLASGDYTVRTGIRRGDEIGELASSIDVLSGRLDEASHESERLNRLRQDFVANISHELRTPVTVIRGSLEALCDEVVKDPAQVKEYHRQMLSESIFLQRLVNDLLDLSRLQNADFAMEMQDVSLCEVLGEAVRSSRQIASAKGIRIESPADAGIPAGADAPAGGAVGPAGTGIRDCVIRGDYGRLRQMFMIILDNAIKFSPENSIVTVTAEGRTVRISDRGPGIPAEDLPWIFDRFYKSSSAENRGGTGLGLAIARQIADRHGIAISVDSVPGRGSDFIFRF